MSEEDEVIIWNETWSPWSLGMLSGCGEKFRRRLIENEILPTGLGAHRGASVHEVVHYVLLAKKEGRALPTDEETGDLAAASFEKAVKKRGVRLNEKDHEVGAEKMMARQKDVAIALSRAYLRTFVPKIDPIEIEHSFSIKPVGWDFKVKCVTDLIARADASTWEPSGGDETLGGPVYEGKDDEVIRDTKTKEKSPSAGEADTSLQLTFEGMMRAIEKGTPPVEYTLDFLWRTPKEKKIGTKVQTTTRSPKDFEGVLTRIQRAHESVERGVFNPAPADSWGCSKNYCEYWETCPYPAHPVSIQV